MRLKAKQYFRWRTVSGVVIEGHAGQIFSTKHPRDAQMLLKLGYAAELKEEPAEKMHTEPKENKMLDSESNENKTETNNVDSDDDQKSDKKSESKKKTSKRK